MSFSGSIGSLVATITADISQFVSGMADAVDTSRKTARDIEDGLAPLSGPKNLFGGFMDSISSAQEALRDLGVAAFATGAALAPLSGAIALLGEKSLETAGEFEQTQAAFKFFMGSASAAREELQQLYTFAANTPFEIKQVTGAAQLLMATGTAAKDIIPDLRIIGDQLFAVGKVGNLSRVIYALNEMKNETKSFGTELRMLLRDGMIPAKQYIEDGFGKSLKGVMADLQSGVITGAQLVEQVLAGMKSRTEGMMAVQAATFLGQMSNLKDNATLTLAAIGKELLPTAKQFTAFATEMLGHVRDLAEWFGRLPQPIKDWAIALAGLTAVAGPLLLLLGGAAFLLGSLSVPILAVTVAVVAVGASMVGLVSLIKTQWNPVVAALRVAWGGVSETWGTVWIGIKTVLSAVWQGIINQIHVAGAVISTFVGFIAGMASKLPGMSSLMQKLGDVKDAYLFAKAQDEIAVSSKKTSTDLKGLGHGVSDLSERMETAEGKTTKFNASLLKWDSNSLTYALHMEELSVKTRIAADMFAAFTDEVTSGGFAKEAEEIASYMNMISDSSAKAGKDLQAVFRDSIAEGVTPINVLKDAYERLGVESTASLLKQAKDAENAYQMIQRSGTATADQIRDAWIKAEEAQQKYVEGAGGKVSNRDKFSVFNQKENKKDDEQGGLAQGLGTGAFKGITGGFNTAIQGMIKGTMTFRMAWGTMIQSMTGAFATAIADWLTKWVAFGLRKLAAHIFVNQAMVADDAESENESWIIKLGYHLKTILMYAKEAAIAAFKSAMALPVPINFIAAPIAAAGAFMGALAVGAVSAEQGADLPNQNTIGMLHPREMVLPQKYANVIRGMADGGSTGSGANFHGDMHYHAAKGESFTPDAWVKMGKQAMRNRPGMRLGPA